MEVGTIATVVGGIITAVFTFFRGKKHERAKVRKVSAEADSIAVSSTEKAVKMWQDLNEELKQELETYRLRMDELHKEYIRVHNENIELKHKVSVLEKEVAVLKEMVGK